MAGFASVVENEGVRLPLSERERLHGRRAALSGRLRPGAVRARPAVPGRRHRRSRSRSPSAEACRSAKGPALTMPVGATHGARFGPDGARIVIVKARGRASGLHFDRLRRLRGLGLLARRLSSELRASDAAAPLAAEGIALELLAATARESAPARACTVAHGCGGAAARPARRMRAPRRGRPRARCPGGPDSRVPSASAMAYRSASTAAVPGSSGQPRKSLAATGRSPRSR